MAFFRQIARHQATMDRTELLKEVAYAMGYRRFGSRIEEVLRGHLRAAIRREIIGGAGQEVWIQTSTMADYSRDTLTKTVYSVMRKDVFYEWEDVVRAVAQHLGFQRLREEVAEPIHNAIRYLVRQSILSKEGTQVMRLA